MTVTVTVDLSNNCRTRPHVYGRVDHKYDDAGVHVPEEVLCDPPDLRPQKHPGDAHARLLHTPEPHLLL